MSERLSPSYDPTYGMYAFFVEYAMGHILPQHPRVHQYCQRFGQLGLSDVGYEVTLQAGSGYPEATIWAQPDQGIGCLVTVFMGPPLERGSSVIKLDASGVRFARPAEHLPSRVVSEDFHHHPDAPPIDQADYEAAFTLTRELASAILFNY